MINLKSMTQYKIFKNLFKATELPTETGFIDLRPVNKSLIKADKDKPNTYFGTDPNNRQNHEIHTNLTLHTLAHLDNRESLRAGLPVQTCLDAFFISLRYSEKQTKKTVQACFNRITKLLFLENSAMENNPNLISGSGEQIHDSYKLVFLGFFISNLSNGGGTSQIYPNY